MEKGIITKDVCLKTKKETFIKNEFWNLTIGGAFQRANVYKDSVNVKAKDIFKSALFTFIDSKSNDYFSPVTDEVHLINIFSVANFSREYAAILKNEELNFGISQKLLNLYLKYLWCLDKLPIPPPHFPVDRIIQQKLKYKGLYPWTKMHDEIEYLKIINFAKLFAIEKGFKSIAELELNYFSRRKDNVKTI